MTVIPREIYWSGFGFQVWMQMVLQFMRGTSETVLVLDEPDIYLHPDLQQKLIDVAKSKFGQVFVATHSSRLIDTADPADVLIVSSDKDAAERVG